MGEIKLITTSDGSHSLLNTALHETYHSIHGAIQESKHVYIDSGLEYWLRRHPGSEIRILEIGFGTGLNALLSLLHTHEPTPKIYFESWKVHPLEAEVISQLNYPSVLSAGEQFAALHQAPWNQSVGITTHFMLNKHQGDVLTDRFDAGRSYDLIYYDAFAPSKQPQLWTLDILRKVTWLLAPGGLWVTYCAKGQVKRDLSSLGLTVETLPGPPGKKEMIRASRG